jgi:hypothetical protein
MYTEKIKNKILAEDESYEDICYYFLSEMLDVEKALSRVDTLMTTILEDKKSYYKKLNPPIAEEVKDVFDDLNDLRSKVKKINKRLDTLSEGK